MASKRPRTSRDGKENVPSSAAEDAMMAELLAGLDESAFSSPVKSQASQRGRVMSPLARRVPSPTRRVKAEPALLEKGQRHTSPVRPTGTTTRPTVRNVSDRAGLAAVKRERSASPPPLDGARRARPRVSEPGNAGGNGLAKRLPAAKEAKPRSVSGPPLRPTVTTVPKREVPQPEDFLGLLGLSTKRKVKAEGTLIEPLKAQSPRLPTVPRAISGSSSSPRTKALGPNDSTAVNPPSSPRLETKGECIPGTQEDYDDDWDLDALAGIDETALVTAPELKAQYPLSHPPVPQPPKDFAPTPFARCVVREVYEGIYDTVPVEDGAEPVSKCGKVDGQRRLVHLKERWADLNINEGDIINIISPNLAADPLVVSHRDTATFLVHHPDVLVTMTSIANSMPCPRRPLISSLVRLPQPPSKAMLYGTILHSLLQGALTEKRFDRDSTARLVEKELSTEERRLEVWGAGMDCDGVAQEVGGKAGVALEGFGKRWIGAQPSAYGNVVTARDEPIGHLAIAGLHDVEEDIWSPKWGLKGKVDASVQAVLRREDGTLDEFVSPLEIKTGRSIGGVQHRAQTMLYTLLMEDRYGLPVPAGLLYYSQRDAIVLVEARANEVRALIMARNELADWTIRKRSEKFDPADIPVSIVPKSSKEPSPNIEDVFDLDESDLLDTTTEVADVEDARFLPETIDRENECKNCYASSVCMLYRKAVDTIPADDPLAELYEQRTSHLTPAQAKFFAHWERLLTLEEQDTVRLRSQLWTMGAEERERKGRCFADMVMVGEETGGGSKIGRWVYTFERAPAVATPQNGPSPSLLAGHITVNDPVSLSLDHLPFLTRGFVVSLKPTSITISVQNQLELGPLLARVRSSHTPHTARFRIDKDEMASGMAKMRGNLAQLFVPDGDERRRELVVDLRTPNFNPPIREVILPGHLNGDQAAAMRHVLAAKDYALILGMPGTGKTTTVAEIIRTLVSLGKSVLLTSYTHSAVDTIASKLVGGDFGVLRLGNPDKVHPSVKPYTLDALGPTDSPEQLEERLMCPPVVATTCLSVDHPLFFRRRFDYCIVDEASQITLPTCLGPLRCADVFVLVGDHFQLPPIVRKQAARAGGLDVSLFRRLSDAHPDAVAPLAAQYRMNAEIMTLSNHLIYENRLRCGSEAVAKQSLVLPHHKTCSEIFDRACSTPSCWLQQLLAEKTKAIFVDTDALPGHESRAGDLVQNVPEAQLIHVLATALASCGVAAEDVAVISPYRQQIKLLSTLFTNLPGVEILTADKAQGRDKDVVLVSLVRSNEAGQIGELLRDWRRINVSFTRAKRKLVIFGSRSTLATDRLLGDFFDLMAGKGWILQLPEGADRLHTVQHSDVKTEQHEQSCDAENNGHRGRKRLSDAEDKENTPPGPKKGKVGDRWLATHPFAGEILQD